MCILSNTHTCIFHPRHLSQISDSQLGAILVLKGHLVSSGDISVVRLSK